ncbi:DNA-binding response regulator, OmpR family, contains REC and winged-helix (wHTH) domain [Paenibacillus sp. UNCCL117]|uniref:response regulator transcription factor n=1 Tax=unclassified Paenibacillus TaxID=185978 RepID=UPI000886437B|nr:MULTISPECIES: response regulator transcription factor [unclassified Paenibacillus]SDD18823.1 DNA-binding response regulator, OmpR family, contains REC and winged-helix (wHTH) domain [Paenibacillus sp. cl123]SFW35328.1 DNA-binding response regulator, OmpR family, contains REC and winged-helix (wHTH) domain [Paenibacillus sp. UNCCL117]
MNPRKKILIVEVEAEARAMLITLLTHTGFEVHEAADAAEAIEQFDRLEPDLVLLNLTHPIDDGLELCAQIRSYSNVPIVMLSGRSNSADIIHGLELGADDYIAMPFSPEVVVARVQANLRRSAIFRRDRKWQPAATLPAREELLCWKGLEIDPIRFQVLLDGEPVALVTKEFQLLVYLARNPGSVFTLEELYSAVWGLESHGNTRTVIVHLSNLRKKLEPHPTRPVYIHNIRGVGYKFDPK